MNRKNYVNLILALEDYIELLEEECQEHASFMAARTGNWRSSRYEKGIELRTKISSCKEQLND